MDIIKSGLYKITLILLVLLLGIGNPVYAQNKDEYSPYRKDHSPQKRFNIGIGAGIDYGGAGGRLTFRPTDRLGIFGAAGYNTLEFAWNVGADWRFFPEKKVTLCTGAMYGYNGVINKKDAEEYDGTYYGPSIKLGIELNSTNRPGSYFNIEILYPFRSQKFHDTWEEIKVDPDVEVLQDPLPITFSLGYHFRF